MLWLVDGLTLNMLQDAHRALREQASQLYEARLQDGMRAGGSRVLQVGGSTAEITVEGLLTKTRDPLARMLGLANTSYRELESALAVAEGDSSVRSVLLNVDSPGGSVDGLFEVVAAVERLRAAKFIQVRASRALSAAYVIAAAGGPIEATSVGSSFGSVGVAASVYRSEAIVDIANTDSPDKRPDVTTAEGRAVIVRELDSIHELVVEAIARGRGVSGSVVTSKYGRGATLLARAAKSAGMVDGIRGVDSKGAVVTTPSALAIVGPETARAREELRQLDERSRKHESSRAAANQRQLQTTVGARMFAVRSSLRSGRSN